MLECQLQKHTFHMTTGRLVSQIHFLHIFAVIKISAVKVCWLTDVEAIKKMKAIVVIRWSIVSFFKGMENLRCIDRQYGLLVMLEGLGQCAEHSTYTFLLYTKWIYEGWTTGKYFKNIWGRQGGVWKHAVLKNLTRGEIQSVYNAFNALKLACFQVSPSDFESLTCPLVPPWC